VYLRKCFAHRPTRTARKFSKSSEQMAGLAILAGLISVGLGLWASSIFDTPRRPERSAGIQRIIFTFPAQAGFLKSIAIYGVVRKSTINVYLNPTQGRFLILLKDKRTICRVVNC